MGQIVLLSKEILLEMRNDSNLVYVEDAGCRPYHSATLYDSTAELF